MRSNRLSEYSMTIFRRKLGFLRDALSLRRLGLVGFLIRQRLTGFDVPSSPFFESEEAARWFSSRLEGSRKYLEFGAGGSTYLAARCGLSFVSVDSDPFFLDAVRKKIEHAGLRDDRRQVYRHADIGFTRDWGMPVFLGKPSLRRLEQFRRYSDFPEACQTGDFVPDFVLVDGRFRVACALKVVRAMACRDDWVLVVDDYVDRPQYHIIADYAKLDFYIGRMAVFSGAVEFDRNEIDVVIRHYEVVPE